MNKIDHEEIFENFLNLEIHDFIRSKHSVTIIFENKDYTANLRKLDTSLTYGGIIITEQHIHDREKFSKFVYYLSMKYVEYLHREQDRLSNSIASLTKEKDHYKELFSLSMED